MRRLLPFALAVLAPLLPALATDRPTTLAPADLATAERLRDQALRDDTAWNFTAGLTTDEIKRAQANALEVAFLSPAERASLLARRAIV